MTEAIHHDCHRYALEGDTEMAVGSWVKEYGYYFADRLDEDGEEDTARRLREILAGRAGNVIKALHHE